MAVAMKTRVTNLGGQIVAAEYGETRYLIEPDALGNTRSLIDETGAEADSYTYWPYGEQRTATVGLEFPFKFCGTWGYYTEPLGGYPLYVRARYYKPPMGRWMTVDPLWPDEQAYGYAAENPINMLDYSGTSVGGTDSLDLQGCLRVWLGADEGTKLDPVSKAIDRLARKLRLGPLCRPTIYVEACRQHYACCRLGSAASCTSVSVAVGISCGVRLADIMRGWKDIEELGWFVRNFPDNLTAVWSSVLSLSIPAASPVRACVPKGWTGYVKGCMSACAGWLSVQGCGTLSFPPPRGKLGGSVKVGWCGGGSISITISAGVKNCD